MSFLVNPYWYVAADCDFTDDFTSYSTQGEADAVYPRSYQSDEQTQICEVNISDDDIEMLCPDVSENLYGACTREADCSVDDTAWVMRWNNYCSAVTQSGGNSARCFVGMSDEAYTGGVTTVPAQSGIGLLSQTQATINNYWSFAEEDGEILGSDGKGTQFSSVDPTATDRDYIEVIRTSSTTYTVEFFSDSGYSNSIEQESDSCASSLTSLNFMSFKLQSSTTGSILGFDIPDVAFANAVTVYPS